MIRSGCLEFRGGRERQHTTAAGRGKRSLSSAGKICCYSLAWPGMLLIGELRWSYWDGLHTHMGIRRGCVATTLFLLQVTSIPGKLWSVLCRGLGSAVALLHSSKCTGLRGKWNLGSTRDQVFWGLQILVHLRVAALCFEKSKEFSILSRPDLIDFDKLKKSNAHYNLQNAFNLAEQHLGLTKLLDPEGKNSCSFSTLQLFVGSFLPPLLGAGHSSLC